MRTPTTRRRVRPAPSRLIVALTAVVLGAGCATTPAPEAGRYVLASEPPPPAEPATTRRVLLVRSVELAPYLDDAGIVMQTSDVAVVQARNHLWADALHVQLSRELRHRLGAQLDGIRVLPSGGNGGADDGRFELVVSVDRFQGRYDGRAVVAGEWRLVDGEGTVRASGVFERERDLPADGYPALVTALRAAWAAVVRDMAADIAAATSPEVSAVAPAVD